MDELELVKILDAHKKWLRFGGGERADLSGTDLRSADLSGTDLRSANLGGADLSDANLSGTDLRSANLSGTDLRSANLGGADLSGAYLSGAYLVGADLSGANLSGANLSGANLSGADLSGAYLSGAYLVGADLSGTDLRSANLGGADLSGANLGGANLGGADLSGAKELLSAINFIDAHFERVADGYIVFKTFGGMYASPESWKIEAGSIITETVNPDRCTDCGSGINVAPLDWVKKNYKGDIWKCLIRFEWLAGVIVPFNTDGKIRCERVELVEIAERTNS